MIDARVWRWDAGQALKKRYVFIFWLAAACRACRRFLLGRGHWDHWEGGASGRRLEGGSSKIEGRGGQRDDGTWEKAGQRFARRLPGGRGGCASVFQVVLFFPRTHKGSQ